MRAVYSADSAALMAIDWTKGDEEEQRLTAKDDKNIGEHRVVAGFQAGDFIYFFGSANRPDLPLKLDLDESRRRTDVRLTRVCKGDTSQMPQQNEKALESRMELVISCGREIGKSADKREIPMPERAVAASQSMDGKSLLVVIEREQSDGQKRNLVCQFEMAQLEAAFDRLWDQCQQVPSKRWQERQCQETKMDQPECYMFSWELEERIPLCRRFGPGGLANCALGPNTVLINRAGWLEDFRPYMGTQLAANLPVESAVVAITNGGSTDDDGGSTFILAMQNGTIQRYAANESAPLWTMIANDKFGPFGITRNPESGHLLFVNENTIRQLALECAAMYPSCEDILWADPLDCRWCAFLNGTGRTIGRDEAEQCQSGFALRSCPPVVAEVAREEGDMLTIWGKRLNLVEGLQIKVCGQYCKVDKMSADTIRCKTSSAPPEGPCKSVLLQGKFEAESNFRINYDLDQQQQSQTGNRKIHPSYVMRVILVIVAILLISIALLVIYCSLYPKLAQRLLRRFTKTPPPDNGYNPIPPTEQLRDYFGRRLSSHIGHHKQNSSSYPFAELESLMVPLGNGTLLNMGTFTLIGEGHFSKVCRALCLRSPEEEHGEFVAVKIIKHSSSIKEIEDEVRVMCGCDHPNIVKYIDHFVDHMQLINIVMEYMGGGDLHNYLRDGRNLPTIMDAFRFILQIASGMDYLTNKMRIVHRDLAARNCMLDSQHQIVKITDFGLSRVLSRNRDEQNEEYIYVYSSDNMQQQLPFRWTAIECFANANPEFSEKTDVWAFGVLVWEIFARDVDPYGRMKSQEVREFLESGQRLENLPKCPDRLYDLLCQCWSADPALRPTFRAILGSVEKLYDELMAQESEYMHSQYGLLNESEYEAPRNSAGTSGSTSAGAISLSTVTTRAGNAGAPPNTSYAI